MPCYYGLLLAWRRGYVVFTEHVAAAGVESVGLLPARSHEPADRSAARSVVRLVNDRAAPWSPSL
jgi:hypothetical protein